MDVLVPAIVLLTGFMAAAHFRLGLLLRSTSSIFPLGKSRNRWRAGYVEKGEAVLGV